MLTVSAFYKYTRIHNPGKFAKRHLEMCKSLGLRGRILVSREGVNGTVCGTEDQVNEYKRRMNSKLRFRRMKFKDTHSEENVFDKMWVRPRKSILNIGMDISPRKGGKRLSPEEFKRMVESEDVVLVDARNDYEWKVGKFDKAITLPMRNFRDSEKALREIEGLKDKKIITYCTGGIRCEKFSALMKRKGFEDVYQLDGGIHNYVEKYPDTHWKGKLFVFDNRLAIQVNGRKEKPISKCDICHKPGDNVINCSNTKCHEMFFSCPSCQKKHNGLCDKCSAIKISSL